MLHYNFPPFSTGEAKMMRSASRREIGHGNLAERALARVLPTFEDFPYTIRIVSETLESNGSSSMAAVCGGCLSLMDAGVPILEPVAGIAMGLIKEGDKVAVLSDILGDEDHLGDMDFKVTGTKHGITALQMDIKIQGLSREILQKALYQAEDGRLHILGKMAEALAAAARGAVQARAAHLHAVSIKPDRIRDVIGPGGKMIRAIIEQTGVAIDVEDDGTISIASSDDASAKKAIDIIKGLTTEPEIGQFYMGVVRRIVDFGAFVEILPGHRRAHPHLASSTPSASTRSPTSSRRATRCWSRSSASTARARSGCRRKEAIGQKPEHHSQPAVACSAARAAPESHDAVRIESAPPGRRAASPIHERRRGRDGPGRASLDAEVTIAPGERALVGSGLAIELPRGIRGAGAAALGAGAQARRHRAQQPRHHRRGLSRRGQGAAHQPRRRAVRRALGRAHRAAGDRAGGAGACSTKALAETVRGAAATGTRAGRQ